MRTCWLTTIIGSGKKYNVTIIDPSKNINFVKNKKTPFKDEGIENFIKNKIVQKNLDYIDYLKNSKKKFDVNIITLGTPIDEWGNPVAPVIHGFYPAILMFNILAINFMNKLKFVFIKKIIVFLQLFLNLYVLSKFLEIHL